MGRFRNGKGKENTGVTPATFDVPAGICSCSYLFCCDQLCRRLENNEPGSELVKWLNSLPAVQEILKKQFDGQPINEPNLTAWRQLQEILRALRHLRHEAHNGQRIQLQRERWDREVERQHEEDLEHIIVRQNPSRFGQA